nr:MAG TPA: MAZG-LIKE NUCLEOSIDE TRIPHOSPHATE PYROPHOSPHOHYDROLASE [Caudoviricetes sp.]
MDQVTNMSIRELQGMLSVFLEITHSKNHIERDMVQKLYREFITEEYNELLAEKPCTANDFKELCDLIWVCIQYANACGYDLEKGMNELVTEYSSKFYDSEGNYNPQFREDGKLLKGTGFKKANFDQFFD